MAIDWRHWEGRSGGSSNPTVGLSEIDDDKCVVEEPCIFQQSKARRLVPRNSRELLLIGQSTSDTSSKSGHELRYQARNQAQH
ncbi:hypothetical protein E4U38_001142 [Claviceps purpurea]|nr:hypothetical protein E4U38_001142 [Claviceps purpurea]